MFACATPQLVARDGRPAPAQVLPAPMDPDGPAILAY
jgi:hypothetical protein